MVIVLHGLGGSCESFYVLRMAAVAYAAGHSTLRLNMRGADNSGADTYHAGLTADVRGALASPELARYRDVLLVGFSLGANVSLRVAMLENDPRLRAVVAIHPPLDLEATCQFIDHPRRIVYRRFLLQGLQENYDAVHALRGGPIDRERAWRIRFIRDWDDQVTAQRWGFVDASDYYARASSGPRLGGLRIPSLIIAERRDPLIPASSLEPYLTTLRNRLTVRWTDRGGHVGYPARTHGSALSLEQQVLDWLRDHHG